MIFETELMYGLCMALYVEMLLSFCVKVGQEGNVGNIYIVYLLRIILLRNYNNNTSRDK